MIAPLFSKFSQEFTDVRLPSHAEAANKSSLIRTRDLPSQVKFYRVDIDEDKIAQTVAEAGVASVVRVLGKADVHVPFPVTYRNIAEETHEKV